VKGNRFSSSDTNGREVAARALRIAALIWSILFTVAGTLFAGGYALGDPGGLVGIGLVLCWVIPILLLIALALRVPGPAWWVLIGVTGVFVAMAVWLAVDSTAIRSWENAHGPVTSIAMFVPMVPLALLGRRRPLSAGLMLLLIGGGPLLANLRTRPFLGNPTTAVSFPLMLAAAFLLVAGLLTRDPESERRPQPR